MDDIKITYDQNRLLKHLNLNLDSASLTGDLALLTTSSGKTFVNSFQIR
jgi:hypothetical protein